MAPWGVAEPYPEWGALGGQARAHRVKRGPRPEGKRTPAAGQTAQVAQVARVALVAQTGQSGSEGMQIQASLEHGGRLDQAVAHSQRLARLWVALEVRAWGRSVQSGQNGMMMFFSAYWPTEAGATAGGTVWVKGLG